MAKVASSFDSAKWSRALEFEEISPKAGYIPNPKPRPPHHPFKLLHADPTTEPPPRH
ncbi:hypothetical protein GJ744_008327 [Endocarpon pusillum]|uniref:Uncharacterized protein n=1 Tax=Endocarpon pusillum TaxID=364733 RepID=A0A8H7AH96_9EURO|nr:hypothetical protein GJ744_008327 [Endocarpon pusillum]